MPRSGATGTKDYSGQRDAFTILHEPLRLSLQNADLFRGRRLQGNGTPRCEQDGPGSTQSSI